MHREDLVADERDPIAATHNTSTTKQDETSDARKANYTDAFDAPDQQGVMGPDNGPQHRAAPGEGVRAPLAQDTGDDAQFSVFDGKGNEKVVVATQGPDGHLTQGTGDDAASARAEAAAGKEHPGSDFGHVGH